MLGSASQRGGFTMAHYLFRGRYTQQGIQGLAKEGATGRRKAIDELVAGLGGHLEACYWAFGDDDILLIVELPGNASAAALALRVSATGAANVSTTVLLTAAEMDEARGLTVTYRPPGA
jgi:uncharacterized protein with GYD domain